MPNDDRIYEAYKGSMGEEFRQQTLLRVDWIVDQAKNCLQVLDIGCSQGIISICMAQKGSSVIGIDIQKENVDFAAQLLLSEYLDLKQRVSFICEDFFKFESAQRFDCIIITEVLEHIENPKAFIKRAKRFLKPDGRIVITLPFGVNDHPDHKKTYYLYDAYELLQEDIVITKVFMSDGWFGVIGDLHQDSLLIPCDSELMRKEEEAFFRLDRKLNNRIKELYESSQTANLKYRQQGEKYNILKEQLAKSQEQISELKSKRGEKQERYDLLEKQILDIKKDFHLTMREDIELLASLKDQFSHLQMQNGYLQRENAEYRRKFSMITDTFPGKVAVKGYRLLKRIKSKLTILFR